MWLNKLKVAIVQKDIDLLDSLLDDLPNLSDPKEIESAIYLLREASEILHTLKDETALSMIQIKKNIDFLRSMESDSASKFDVMS
jgi:hypothetical protein